MIGDELLIVIPLNCVCRQFVLVHDFVSVFVGIDCSVILLLPNLDDANDPKGLMRR